MPCGPTYVCTCCHRLLYKNSVVILNIQKYKYLSKSLCSELFSDENNYVSADNKVWMCLNCDVILKKGKVPGQAKYNNLALKPIPEELSSLNSMEIMLISKRIPFMKLVSLPRGKQIAIHGPAVNVPTNMDTICNLLPRIPSEAQLVPFKLKRKLQYKGHYMYQTIRPDKIMIALNWLKDNNEHYSDIEINQDWEKSWDEHLDQNAEETSEINDEQKDDKSFSPACVTMMPESHTQSLDSFDYHTLEHLEYLVQKKGFIIEDVEGDGNCFYRAVEKQLELVNLPNRKHTELRQDLALFLDKGPKTRDYSPFIAQPVANNELGAISLDTEPKGYIDECIANIHTDDQTEIRWIHYINKMSSGAWTDHIAVQAMADMLSVNIQII